MRCSLRWQLRTCGDQAGEKELGWSSPRSRSVLWPLHKHK